jgi:3-phosphoshikimate 1-carboxyvinyltransferase
VSSELIGEPRRQPIDVKTTVPGSKSVANRALVCAALGIGVTDLHNLPDGDDTSAMIAGLNNLGVDVSHTGSCTHVRGTNGRIPGGSVWAGLAGTTSRFALALGACSQLGITVDGEPRLRERPIGPLLAALSDLGCEVSHRDGRLPATVHGPVVNHEIAIAGDISSQYISALMMVAPYFPSGLTLRITTPLVSRPYVDLTAAVMSIHGHSAIHVADDVVTIGAGGYAAVAHTVEADASSASYPLALAALLGGSVTVEGLGIASTQGDAVFVDILRQMGMGVEQTVSATRVSRDEPTLRPVDLNLSNCSDLVPTVAAVATIASGSTVIRGVGFIRNKESDRISDLGNLLRAFGADVDETDDGLVIHGDPQRGVRPPRSNVATCDDHRLAMVAGILGSVTGGTTIEDADVVSKSWPGFWSALRDWTA